MRDAAFACIRRIGVDTGGSNIQFAVNPDDGEMVVIEMNPRVSRSSALASKATGFPIAKIAARLAVGYRLDEITNDITQSTPASFEPTIDYVVTKVPALGVREAAGDTDRPRHADAVGRRGHGDRPHLPGEPAKGAALTRARPPRPQLRSRRTDARRALRRRAASASAAIATPDRPFHLEAALRRGITVERLAEATRVDPWFLDQIAADHRVPRRPARMPALEGTDRRLLPVGRNVSDSRDAQLAWLWGCPTRTPCAPARQRPDVVAVFKTVDTCAAEFDARTPYHYSTYEDASEVEAGDRPTVVILGSGPNRIGQGIEFDYCCVHASFALRDAGFDTVMVNCNPETVSTDYDTSTRLYFEPLTVEDVLNVIDAERTAGNLAGVIVALGGQTPLKLAGRLPPGLVLGTSAGSIDLAEDRERWGRPCAPSWRSPSRRAGRRPRWTTARQVVERIGYPALVRPSYVLGGRAMEIVYDDESLARAMEQLSQFGSLGREGGLSAERPVLIDRFLEDAIEVDVDAIRDAYGRRRDRRGDGARRGGGRALGRLGLRDPATDAVGPARSRVIEGYTRGHRRRARRPGPRQRPVRGQGRPGLRDRGQPPGQPDGAVRGQGDRRPVAKVAARVMVGATLAALRDEGLLRAPDRRAAT